MPDLTPFEARLTQLLEEDSMAGIRPVDRYAIARTVIDDGPRHRSAGPLGVRRSLVPILLGLLLVSLAAGVALVGSRLLERRPDQPGPVIIPIERDRAYKALRVRLEHKPRSAGSCHH